MAGVGVDVMGDGGVGKYMWLEMRGPVRRFR